MNEEAHAARLLPADDPANILEAAALLRRGGVVAIPTDTVYGLAASVWHPAAVARVFIVKRRAPDSAVPVLTATASDLPLLASNVPSVSWKLIDRFWPGPLTLVFPARPSLDRTITGGGTSVAVRVPGSRTCLQLLEAVGDPLVGTSANLHGSPPALRAGEVVDAIGGEIDCVLAADSEVREGIASTVVGIGADECIIFREGVIPVDSIRRAVGFRVQVRR